MYFTVANDAGGHARWWLYANNNKMVAHSGESFVSSSGAKEAAQNFKKHAAAWTYEVYADSASQYRWRAKAGNGQVVGSSGEAFLDRANAQRAADNVRMNAGAANGP